MKIVSWNVNGLRACIDKDFISSMVNLDADIICVQEIKCNQKQLKLKFDGYIQYWNSSRRNGYAGVLTLLKYQPLSVKHGFGINEFDIEGRLTTIEYDDFYVLNVYFPMSQSGLKRKEYRQEWDKHLLDYIKILDKQVVICGDFNVAHDYIDIYKENYYNNPNPIGFETSERENFNKFLNECNLVDIYRERNKELENKYTWWSYRLNKRAENRGWRLDYFLITASLSNFVQDVVIHDYIFGSDHCPISLNLDLQLYQSDTDLKKKILLANKWDNANWKQLEHDLFEMQRKLSMRKASHNEYACKKFQEKIINSECAKMLAVRKVCKANSEAGIDGVKWVSSYDKMQAVLSLTSSNYKCSPYKNIKIYDEFTNKERVINIPTYFDRALQTLYAYALEPISEVTADRKSCAFRRGRSTFDTDAYIRNALKTPGDLFILKGDIKSYYSSISHDWVLKNIPLNQVVLKEFLRAGAIMNGVLYPTEQGISLGSPLSPLISNMVLDGLHWYIYDNLYKDEKAIDFRYGSTIRFADDFIITAKSKEQALIIKKLVIEFLTVRGLKLSEDKTEIISIEDGFEFLSRHYIRKNDILSVTPSENSIRKIESKFKDTIEKYKGSIERLIRLLNSIIIGYSSYQRITDCEGTFSLIDNRIQLLLVEKIKIMHPTRTWSFLKEMYWYENHAGEHIFTDPNNRSLQLIRMRVIKTVYHHAIRTEFSYFLSYEAFEKLETKRAVQKVTGSNYKALWNSQSGLCYHCNKPLLFDQSIEIIDISGSGTASQIYIHKNCKLNFYEFSISSSNSDFETLNIDELVESVKSKVVSENISYYHNLYLYFLKEKRQVFTLTFEKIEDILGDELSPKAFILQHFWYDELEYKLEYATDIALLDKTLEEDTNIISQCWIKNGYIIQKLDLENKKIIFRKQDHTLTNINIPKALLNKKIPKDAQHELSTFFKYIIKKYKI